MHECSIEMQDRYKLPNILHEIHPVAVSDFLNARKSIAESYSRSWTEMFCKLAVQLVSATPLVNEDLLTLTKISLTKNFIFCVMINVIKPFVCAFFWIPNIFHFPKLQYQKLKKTKQIYHQNARKTFVMKLLLKFYIR